MYKFFDFCCPSCSHCEERMIKDGDIQKCKKCGAEMHRLVSAPGMVKGNFFNDKAGLKSVRKS